MEHYKNEGLKVQANLVEKILNDVELAKKLDKYINQKKIKENEIPLDEAAAFLVYMDLSEAKWGLLKKVYR